jgi:hypothetical protein
VIRGFFFPLFRDGNCCEFLSNFMIRAVNSIGILVVVDLW